MLKDVIIRLIPIILLVLFFYILFVIINYFQNKKLKNDNYLLLCPKCGSDQKKSSIRGVSFSPLLASGKPTIFECSKCGYEGTFVEVDKGNIAEFQKKIKRH